MDEMTTHQHRVEAEDAWNDAFKRSTMAEPAEQAQYLLANVGPRYTTLALGMRDARQVKKWAAGGGEPREHDVVGRLRLLFRIVNAITQVYGDPNVAAAFLRSANPQLDDEAPLMVLGEGNPDEVQGRLLAATRAFLEG